MQDLEHNMSNSDDQVLVNDLHGEYLQVLATVQLNADRTECHLLKACQFFRSHIDSSVRSTVESWLILHNSESMACPGSTLAHFKE